MFNPTWLYAGIVYAGAVWAARRGGIDLPARVAVFFYALVFVFLYPVLTQDAVNTSVDFLGTLPPWAYTVRHHRVLNGQMNDLALQIIPWAHQVRESWRSLTPPLWNPFSAAGYPLLASAQSSALSPLRILGLPLSLAHAMSFEAAMKILIALTFMYLWCRRRGYSEMASTFGAVAFGFSTFIVVWLHFPLITTACLVPAVFYVIDLLAERVTFGRFVALSAIGAAMLFGGHPETVSHTAFLASLYVLWIVLVERASPRILLAIAGAAVVTALLAAPFLAPFAEAVTKSKRYQELEIKSDESLEVPFSDWPSAILLLSPHFHGEVPYEAWGPAHAESISGYAGILGIAAWFAVAAHVITKRRWRSREFFFVLVTIPIVGIILSWPGVSDFFHMFFRYAANARVRLLLALVLAMLTAAAIDLMAADRRSFLIGVMAAAAMLLTALHTSYFWSAYQRDTAVLSILPGAAILALATLIVFLKRHDLAILLLLVASTGELWELGRDWNPVVSEKWMYPKTKMLRAFDDITAKVPKTAPFRIVANGATFFPNVSSVYGYEDARAHDPMTNGRYIGLLSHVVDYDAENYFAPWPDWSDELLDYLNVRYVLTSWRGELPASRYRMIYDDYDGRIFENTQVLPRFFPVRNVILIFNDADFARALKTNGWHHTALLEKLEIEAPEQRDDFFKPRPLNAPVAKAEIISASPTDFTLHVRAPRWSVIASSLPWWPGWKVERNGVIVEPLRVNGAFLGIAVPPGELDVHVWYDPWTFRFGAIVAAATLIALVTYGVRRRA